MLGSSVFGNPKRKRGTDFGSVASLAHASGFHEDLAVRQMLNGPRTV